jgi:hypothetical protein
LLKELAEGAKAQEGGDADQQVEAVEEMLKQRVIEGAKEFREVLGFVFEGYVWLPER